MLRDLYSNSQREVLEILFLVYACLLASSLLASFFYNIFLYPPFSFLGFGVIAVAYLICYFFFAVPFQILLRRNPQMFSIRFLAVYLTVSTLCTSVLIIFFGSSTAITGDDLLHILYLSVPNAVIFWVIDSLMLREDRII